MTSPSASTITPAPCPVDLRIRLAVIAIIVLGLSYASRRYHLDDALIYARYISHALHGRGLTFNDGEPVNALTSVLDTWLNLGFASLLHGRVIAAQLLLSAAFFLGACWLAEFMVPLAGLFLSTTAVFYLCSGMETALFLFILTLCALAYATGRLNWLPLLCALAFLTRFEGGAIGLVIALRLWQTRRAPRLWAWSPVLLLLAIYLVFNLHFFHVLLPQSASAKLGQGASGFWGRWPTAFLRVPDIVVRPAAGSWVALLALAWLTWRASKTLTPGSRLQLASLVVFPFMGILAAFYVLCNIPNYHWYYTPFVFFLVLYAVSLVPATRRAWTVAAVFIICLTASSENYLRFDAPVWTDYEQMGRWLNQNTPPGARIATTETGTIGWYCDRNIIDMAGVTTPKNATYTAHHDATSWLNEKPDFVIVHPDSPFIWEKAALASPDYAFVPVHFGKVYLLQRR